MSLGALAHGLPALLKSLSHWPWSSAAGGGRNRVKGLALWHMKIDKLIWVFNKLHWSLFLFIKLSALQFYNFNIFLNIQNRPTVYISFIKRYDQVCFCISKVWIMTFTCNYCIIQYDHVTDHALTNTWLYNFAGLKGDCLCITDLSYDFLKAIFSNRIINYSIWRMVPTHWHKLCLQLLQPWCSHTMYNVVFIAKMWPNIIDSISVTPFTNMV